MEFIGRNVYDGVTGFHYVPADADPVAVGERVRAPGLVVAVASEHTLMPSWPGRVYRVEVVPPETPDEQAALAVRTKGLRPNATSTPVSAVDIVEEVDPAVLFGPHGAAVAQVLNQAWTLTVEEAQRLADGTHPGAIEAASRIWARWTPDGTGSPVGRGTYLAWEGVRRVAERHDAFAVDGDGEVSFAGPWGAAESAIRHAALAYGAPDLVAPGDHDVLTAAWRTAFPDPGQA